MLQRTPAIRTSVSFPAGCVITGGHDAAPILDGMPLTGTYQPSTSARSRDQVELYEATNAEQGGDLRGRPVIVLTSIGARTGKLRKTPLMRVEHDGVYAVVASQGGAPKHPVWYHNLKQNPHVELQDRATKRDYLAREVTGAEKATWWARAVEAWPYYADYQLKTDRQIPVFVLEAIT
jgi:deazaflavin-dependent oxidoreductase (nitroreductase family)